MRRIIRCALLATLLFSACGEAPARDGTRADVTEKALAAASVADLDQITLTVPNMACHLCARSIEHALTNAGLKSISVDLEKKLVVVRYDPKRITPDAVKKIVTDLGYTVSDVSVG